MSTSWNTTAVDKFLKTVKTARDYNSKEIKISTTDAEQLVMSLAHMLNQEREMVQKIMMLQDKLINATSSVSTEVNLNGGGF
jgi:ethanolamine transporter EutH